MVCQTAQPVATDKIPMKQSFSTTGDVVEWSEHSGLGFKKSRVQIPVRDSNPLLYPLFLSLRAADSVTSPLAEFVFLSTVLKRPEQVEHPTAVGRCCFGKNKCLWKFPPSAAMGTDQEAR